MPCNIKNPANYQLGELEDHIHGMYDHFESKYGFKKPPTMVFDSDPSNQSEVLGKTAYYDPQSLEIHIFVDGRHPKDVLRSIAHELIHHRQNMEGRLDTGGYSGPGYYLENDNLKEVEHEAMLDGNATMREYEDTVKYKEKDTMSLKEWKNNELNRQLLKRFGILKENRKPDFLDLDKDGDKEEPMADAAKDEQESVEEGKMPSGLEKYHNKQKKNKKSDDDDKPSKPSPAGAAVADEEEEKEEVAQEGKMPPGLEKYHNKKKNNKKSDDDDKPSKPSPAGAAVADEEEEKEEVAEGRNNPRTTNADKFVGHEDRYQADRIHEGEEELEEGEEKYEYDKDGKIVPHKRSKAYKAGQKVGKFVKDKLTKKESLQEAIKKIAKAKKVTLNGKRIK